MMNSYDSINGEYLILAADIGGTNSRMLLFSSRGLQLPQRGER